LLCFLTFNEIYQIPNRQNQSVVNAFQYVLSHPCHAQMVCAFGVGHCKAKKSIYLFQIVP
jgi:hypothetical protein